MSTGVSFDSAFLEVRLYAINAGYALVIETVFPIENVTECDYPVLAMFDGIHTEPVVQRIKTLIENSMRVFIVCITSSILHSQTEKLLETCKDRIKNFPLPRIYSLKIQVLVF